jgi:hypothetical protein
MTDVRPTTRRPSGVLTVAMALGLAHASCADRALRGDVLRPGGDTRDQLNMRRNWNPTMDVVSPPIGHQIARPLALRLSLISFRQWRRGAGVVIAEQAIGKY